MWIRDLVLQCLRSPKGSYPYNATRVRVAFPIAFILLFALLFAGYLYATGVLTLGSDAASFVLEAQAMLHGNLVLHGWYLPPDTFMTTAMPLDALLSIFFRGDQLFRITPALLYATTVTCSAYLATRRVPDPKARWLAALACVALLAFPVGSWLSSVLLAPIHMATVTASLFAWWAYDRFVHGQSRRASLGLFVATTTLAIVGDPLAEVLIVLPVGIVCAWVLWRAHWHETTARTMLIATGATLVAGLGLRQLLIATGTHIASAAVAFSSPALVWQHVQWFWLAVCALFHINVRDGMGFDGRLLFALLNGGFLVLVVAGFVKLLRHSLAPTTMQASLTAVLSWAIVVGFAAYLFSDYAQDLSGIRYLVPPFVCAGILCYSALTEVISMRSLQRFVAAFLAIGMLTFGVALAQHSPPAEPEQPLIAFLESHHLTSGLGTYWATNITTLRTDGEITLTPVDLYDGRIQVYRWHASDDWFAPGRLEAAQFLVIDGSVPVGPFQAAVVDTFGAPEHIYHVDQYTIFAWAHAFVRPSSWGEGKLRTSSLGNR